MSEKINTKPFILHSDFKPSGDQPQAIAKLAENLEDGLAHQTLLGVTGSGKTFTIANVIAQLNRPAMLLAPNKTLAAQLYAEMKAFFPENAVEYFVSYYDYYQPEAYVFLNVGIPSWLPRFPLFMVWATRILTCK